MANRHFVFDEDLVEIPPPRRLPTPAREIPPGVPPAEEGWTPVRFECPDVIDGTPSTLLLYSRPCTPSADARQQQTTIDDRPELLDGRRWSPEPLQVEGATRVVYMTKMLSPGDRLEDDGFYRDFLEDVTEEARKFGDLVKVVIPRPGPRPGGADPAGAGKVFLEYACLDQSIRCWERMSGRFFGGRQIVAGFYPEDMFAAGDYGFDG